jgi:N-acetylglucosaminyl-diphospho-decaprenol L-rhamnosyltransferase
MHAVGIIIVTYNSADAIGACLDAAIATGADIIVVDNASADATVENIRAHPVRLIANETNRGFAGAVNQGAAALENPYLLLLNPDAVIQSSIEPLREACDLPQSAGAGGLLLDDFGHLQAGFMARQLPTPAALILEAILLNRCWPNNPVNRRYRLYGRDYKAQFIVEQPAGAFFMVRREIWRELGGMDEGFYPVWFEDVDFCKRVQQRGLTLYYVPKAVAKHTGGHSVGRIGLEMRPFYWYRSLLRYAAKYFQRGAFRVVCLSVVLGCFLRGLVESATERSIKPMQAYGKGIRLAGRSLVFGFRL